MYVLSKPTADKILDLIGPEGTKQKPFQEGNASRWNGYVRCVSWDSETHTGTGVVVDRDATGWTDFGVAEDMLLVELNDGDLAVGERYPATRHQETEDGQTIFVAEAPVKQKSPLGMPCLIRDGYGEIVGIAQRWVQTDGTVKCETAGDCEGEGCGSDSVPVSPPPPPPPPDPPTPPDPPPETYSIFVSITECERPPEDSGFPYTVTAPSSIQGVIVISAADGGGWFTGIPWGTSESVCIATSEMVWWTVGTVGCGGTTSSSIGACAPVPHATCDNMAVAFSVGTCGPVPTPSDLEEISIEAPPIDP